MLVAVAGGAVTAVTLPRHASRGMTTSRSFSASGSAQISANVRALTGSSGAVASGVDAVVFMTRA